MIQKPYESPPIWNAQFLISGIGLIININTSCNWFWIVIELDKLDPKLFSLYTCMLSDQITADKLVGLPVSQQPADSRHVIFQLTVTLLKL